MKPGMATTRRKATLRDLYRVKGKAKLVNGNLVMAPTGDLPSRAAGTIYASLLAYERRTGRPGPLGGRPRRGALC